MVIIHLAKVDINHPLIKRSITVNTECVLLRIFMRGLRKIYPARGRLPPLKSAVAAIIPDFQAVFPGSRPGMEGFDDWEFVIILPATFFFIITNS